MFHVLCAPLLITFLSASQIISQDDCQFSNFLMFVLLKTLRTVKIEDATIKKDNKMASSINFLSNLFFC